MTDRDTDSRSTAPAARAAAEGFLTAFGRGAEVIVRSPGRVNLIGDHTDYTGGWVLPVAVDRALWVAAARSPERRCAAFSAQFHERHELPIERTGGEAITGWVKYVHAVLAMLRDQCIAPGGVDLWIGGDLPSAAGLASSAALEVGVAIALRTLAGRAYALEATAQLCRRAENELVGAPCGLMDQLCCVAARRGHALLLDCRAERIEHVPLPWEKQTEDGAASAVTLLVIDSGVRHSIAGGGYGDRRSECEQALRVAQRVRPGLSSLRDLCESDLARLEDELPSMLFRRVRHVVGENARVLAAVDALREGDLVRVGRLMNASHESLRDDFEVSCPEMELIVCAVRSVRGVLGARMTGGGFGGCAIALVNALDVTGLVERHARIGTVGQAAGGTRPTSDVDGLIHRLRELGPMHGVITTVFPARSADGAEIISNA